jgi:DNA-binding SARP family transcriptional activator
MGVEFRILGPLEVVRDGRVVPLGGTGMRALLAVLLLHANELVASDRLIEELWGERSPARGANTVQVYVSRLRKLLGRELIETQPAGYLLRAAPELVDLHRFSTLLRQSEGAAPASAAESLRRALALWRGDPLGDLAGEDCAQAEIRRLEELRAVALERLLEVELALGNRSIVAESATLVARYPLRERLRGHLMLALYREGRQAEALEAYRETRRMLSDELGLEPGEPLRALEQAILRQDPALLVPVQPPAASAAPPGAVVVVDDGTAAVELGALLAECGAGPELVVARIVAAGMPDELVRATEGLRGVQQRLRSDRAIARIAAFSSPDPAADVARLASQQDATLVLIDCADPNQALDGGWHGKALVHVACDVGLVVAPSQRAARDGTVVVPFGAAHHDWAALELGAWLARAGGLALRLVGAVGVANGGGRDASRLLADASLIVQRCAGVVAEPVLGAPGVEGVLAAAAGAAMLVVPLSERWQTEGLGAVRAEIARRSTVPTVFVRRGTRPGGLAPPESRTQFTWSLAGG